MNRLVVEIPDTLEAKLKEIANSTNSTIERNIKWEIERKG